MKRRLFTLLSALSLLLFVALVVLWVRSYFVGDVLRHLDATTWTDCASSSGWFYVTVGDAGSSGSRYSGPRWLWHSTAPAEVAGDRVAKRGMSVRGHRFASFEWIRADYGERFVTIVIPYWCPAFAALGAGTLLLWHRPRTRPGLCPACGYDLRATPNRCPECGHVASPPPP